MSFRAKLWICCDTGPACQAELQLYGPPGESTAEILTELKAQAHKLGWRRFTRADQAGRQFHACPKCVQVLVRAGQIGSSRIPAGRPEDSPL